MIDEMNAETSNAPDPAPPQEPPRGGLFGGRPKLQSPREALQPEAAPPPPPPPPPSKRRPTLSALSGFFSFLLIAAFVLNAWPLVTLGVVVPLLLALIFIH